MGDVIALGLEPSAGRRRTPKSEPAKILFFTGVRYERWTEPAAVASPDQGEKHAPKRRRRTEQRA